MSDPVDRELLQSALDAANDARQQLEDTQRLLNDFLDGNPALSFIKDEQGRYLYASRGFREFFKVRAEDFIGKTDFEWLSEETARQFTDNDKQVRETGQPLQTIEDVPAGDGVVKSLVCKFPLVGPGGRRYVGGIAFDITARMKEQELRAQYSAIVDYSHDAIIGTNTMGQVTSWNRSAVRMLGYTANEVHGKPFEQFLQTSSDDQEKLKHPDLSTLEGIEIRCKTKSGQYIDLSLTISSIRGPEEELQGLSIIARDITSRKATDRQLKYSALELAEARDRALEASSLKSAFVANISHELRTPLAGILGITDMLAHSEMTEYQSGLVQTLKQSADALLVVVNDLLDLSKIEAGKVSLELAPFNLNFLVQECARLLAATIQDKDVTLRTNMDHSIPEFVIGDAERIRQTLVNLIGNAIKFTERGSVEVVTTREASDDKSVTIRFSVKDTGIGVSDEEKRFLFKPFTQVDGSSTRKYSGTGLGLSISKQLVELMGGRIGINSVKGAGAEFWFAVSFSRCAPEVQPQKVNDTAGDTAEFLRGRNVLVVEDNELLRTLTVTQLKTLGVNARGAVHGVDAVEEFQQDNYDLIFMDCQLPLMDGFEATRRIREIEKETSSHTPIVALTAGAMKGDRERCMDAGMDDYLTKPASVAQLREKLIQWVGLKRTRQS